MGTQNHLSTLQHKKLSTSLSFCKQTQLSVRVSSLIVKRQMCFCSLLFMFVSIFRKIFSLSPDSSLGYAGWRVHLYGRMRRNLKRKQNCCQCYCVQLHCPFPWSCGLGILHFHFSQEVQMQFTVMVSLSCLLCFLVYSLVFLQYFYV